MSVVFFSDLRILLCCHLLNLIFFKYAVHVVFLTKCSFNGMFFQKVIFLVEALSEAPMISKLDLSGNNLTDNVRTNTIN